MKSTDSIVQQVVQSTIQQILHSGDQYLIPVFQRSYVWEKPRWEELWEDIVKLLEAGSTARHFLVLQRDLNGDGW
jgi:uncharacterized protein with ParB-like and HNH nuclease domain